MNTKNTKTIIWHKKLVAIMIALLMLVTLAVGFVQKESEAPVLGVAEMTEVPATDFWLEDGAAVRYGKNAAGEQVNGLRYTFQIKSSVYAANNEYTKYGILIAPKDYNLTPETVFGDSAIYDWAEKVNGEWVYNGTKTRIANLPVEVFEDDTLAGVEIKQFYGSLTGLKEANIVKEFRGVAYVGKSSDGVKYTYEFVSNDTNVRSMAYVAQCAKEDPESSADLVRDMDTLYLNKASVLATASSYTTEYYFEQANGEYAINSEETTKLESTINATVAPVVKTFDNYVVNAEKSDASAIVYANDKTVLKVYYSLEECTITYDLGELANDEYVEIEAATTSVQYSKTATLLVPTCDGYVFKGWKNAEGEFVGATLTCAGDETLTAVWEKDESADRWGPWSPIV